MLIWRLSQITRCDEKEGKTRVKEKRERRKRSQVTKAPGQVKLSVLWTFICINLFCGFWTNGFVLEMVSY
jgi:hypothetical protein